MPAYKFRRVELSCSTGLFRIAAISLAVFLVTELTIKEPLIDLSLFKGFNFAVCT